MTGLRPIAAANWWVTAAGVLAASRGEGQGDDGDAQHAAYFPDGVVDPGARPDRLVATLAAIAAEMGGNTLELPMPVRTSAPARAAQDTPARAR
jgi:hypothetical protein